MTGPVRFVRYFLLGVGSLLLLVILLVAGLCTYATARESWLQRQARVSLPSYRLALPAGTQRAQVARWAADHHVLLVTRGGNPLPEDMLLMGRAPALSLWCEASDIGIQVRYRAPWPAMATPADPVLDVTAAEWPGACV